MKPDDLPPRANERLDAGDLSLALSDADSRAQSPFERHYAAAVPALVAWTRLRIAGLPSKRIDVDDVLQETWTRAFERFAQYTEGSSFRHWVIGIAQNVLYEALRRDRRGRARGVHGAGESVSLYPDSVTSISRAAARDESFSRLMELIFDLPMDEQQLLLMHGLEERPLAFVAQRLEISEEAVGKRWQRLRARLREQPAFVAVMQG